jgi:hypothetical protein
MAEGREGQGREREGESRRWGGLAAAKLARLVDPPLGAVAVPCAHAHIVA